MSQKKKDQFASLTKKSQVIRPRLSTIELPSSWQTLPNIIFGDILVMVGLNSLEDFKKCHQVCQSWNVIIAHMTKYEKDTIRREADNLASQIRKNWMFLHEPKLPEITTAASLVSNGLLGSVEEMLLRDVDLVSVPTEHLASLASCVTSNVFIWNVGNLDIISFLGSLKCERLDIRRQTLSSVETRALVRAMETRVERVELQEVNLDITALTQYSGQGRCRLVEYYNDFEGRSKKELKSWAKRIDWIMRWYRRVYFRISAYNYI